MTGGALLPFTQDFDGGNFPPSGWTLTGGDGQGQDEQLGLVHDYLPG